MPKTRLVKDGVTYEQSEDGFYVDMDGNPVQGDEADYYVDEDGNPVDPNDHSVAPDNEPWGAEDQFRPTDPDIIEPGAPDPTAPRSFDLSVIDWGTVQATNQAAVKDLDVDAQLPFWQAEGYVLIGTDHDKTWREQIEIANGYGVYDDCDGDHHPNGTLVMARKGRLTDPGKLTIYGSPDEQATKLAIGEWSQKKVEFA